MKVPPHNIDAERAVLGACMLSQSVVADVLEVLLPGSFYLESHNVIFDIICQLTSENQVPDLVTVTNCLLSRGDLEKVGGAVYIADLANFTPTAANAEYYARIVADKAKARRILEAAMRITAQGYGMEYGELATMAEAELYKALGGDQGKSGPEFIASTLTGGALTEMINADPSNLQGIRPPWNDLCLLVPVLAPTDLVIVAGRPAMGKTAFGLQMCIHAARNSGTAAFFSMEMGRKQVAARIISMTAPINGHFMRTGRLNDIERNKIADAGRGIVNDNLPLVVDPTPELTVAQVRSRAQKIRAKHGLSLICVDYLQLMRAKAENRTQEIGAVSRGLKAIAKEMDVPVLALAQLSRSVEYRSDKRPTMSDLRESGQIEADSDTIMLLYRDEYYNPDTEKKGIAEVLVKKSRHGPTGTADLYWQGEFTRFMSLARRVGNEAYPGNDKAATG